MLHHHSRVRAKALTLAATMALVFSFFGLLTTPTVSRADFTPSNNAGDNKIVNRPPLCPTAISPNGSSCCFFPGANTTNYSQSFVSCEVPPVVPPEAHLMGSLWVSPDRIVAINPESVVAVKFKVANVGPGDSTYEHLVMPFSPSLVAAYTNFSDPGVWVTKVEADKITVDLPDLASGKSVEGTIFFRPNPNNMPVDGQKVTFGFKVAYSDSHGNESAESNKVTVAFGNLNTDQTTGKVMEMTPAALVATAGDTVQVTAKSFAPGEKVSTWITSPDGTGKALKDDRADDKTGDYTVVVNTTGLAAGDYVVAVYGHDSDITFRAIVTVK